MTRFLLIGSALLALTALPAVALTTPTPGPTQQQGASGNLPLQTVTVDGISYTVDPYYPMQCFIMERSLITGQITLQCFERVGSTMTPLDLYKSQDIGVSPQADLAQPLDAIPHPEQTP